MALDPQKGLWLVPTRGRVHTKLPRFIEALKASGTSTHIRFLLDATDFDTNRISYAKVFEECREPWSFNWSSAASAAERTNEMVLAIFHPSGALASPHIEWIGWLGDDAVPETPGWDVKLIERLNGHNVVSSADGVETDRLAGAIAFSADLLRTVGYMFVPGSQHYYVDDMWETLGRLTQCWQRVPDVMVRHRNPMFEGHGDATTALVKTYWANDERAYARWKRDDMQGAAQRIADLMKSRGAITGDVPDLRGVRLAIATPCGSGKYERVFMDSLLGSFQLLKHFGAEVVRYEMPYMSDIAMARNRLFGMFLRSECTHMLFVDDDMGWRPEDIIRLLVAKRDFAAVAGIRKVREPSYAVNCTDDDGQPLPVTMDAETGFLKVTEVGLAFTLLTHSLVERMAQAYPDLLYVGPDGREEHGLFMPMIVNKRYRAEDYAFCYRWRALGGEVLVCPEITLQHVGSHVWSGNWLEQLAEKMREERSVA